MLCCPQGESTVICPVAIGYVGTKLEGCPPSVRVVETEDKMEPFCDGARSNQPSVGIVGPKGP